MLYTCKICNFSTKYTTNFNKHNESKTHINLKNKSENKIKKRQIQKKNQNDILLNELNNITEKITINLNKKLDNIEKLQKETNYGVKKITDYINFLNTYCLDATPLKSFSFESVNKLLKLNDYSSNEFEESIIKYVKKGKLHIKIGNIVLSKFLKPNDLTKQQIWTSDISRLIYLILTIIGSQKNWIRDKKGEIFSELILDPIIKRINEIMLTYAKQCLKKFNKNNDDINTCFLENAELINEMVAQKYSTQLKKDILKYMAIKFSIVSKKDEIFEKQTAN